MDFDRYQQDASRTIPPEYTGRDLLNLAALGLAGEAGEFVELVKKHLFHGKDLDRAVGAKEIGDVLWYCAAAATAIGWSLGSIAEGNIAKLHLRYHAGFTEAASEARVDVGAPLVEGPAYYVIRESGPLRFRYLSNRHELAEDVRDALRFATGSSALDQIKTLRDAGGLFEMFRVTMRIDRA